MEYIGDFYKGRYGGYYAVKHDPFGVYGYIGIMEKKREATI